MDTFTAPLDNNPEDTLFGVSLPIPPSVNRYLVPVKGRNAEGKEYIRHAQTKEAKQYKQVAGLIARSQQAPYIPEGEIYAKIMLYRPSRRGDPPNYLKIVIDAMKGILWTDDKQVTVGAWDGRISLIDPDHPRLEILYGPLQEQRP